MKPEKSWSGATYSKAANLATVLVGGVLLLLLGALFFSSPIWLKWKDDSTTASWAQVFSSVAAILFGAGAIFWQVRRQGAEREEERKAAEARVLHTLQQELFGCRFALERLSMQPLGSVEDRLREIHGGIARLRELRISDLADWQAHLAIRRLVEELEARKLRGDASIDKLRQMMVFAENHFQSALQQRGFELLPLQGDFVEAFSSRRYLVKAGDSGPAIDVGPFDPDLD